MARWENLHLPASGTHGITKSTPVIITKAVGRNDMPAGLGILIVVDRSQSEASTKRSPQEHLGPTESIIVWPEE